MESFRMPPVLMILLLLSPAFWLAAGCSSDEARDFASRQDGPLTVENEGSPADVGAGFQAELVFSRKVSRKSGRPIGVASNFQSANKSYVNALLTCSGVRSDRTYVVHMVWVKPDGKEIFRRYAEVRSLEEPGEGVRTSSPTWTPRTCTRSGGTRS
jgi:hypothetical protein